MTGQSLITCTWLSITSWITPTALFLFLNLVIGTIAVTSRFTSHKKPQQQLQNENQLAHPQLVRAPSLLDRVKSINFSLYKFPQYPYPPEQQEEEQPPVHFSEPTQPVYDENPIETGPPQLTRAPSLLECVKSFKLSSIYRSQQPYPETEAEINYNSETDTKHSSDPNQGLESDPGHKPRRSKSESAKSKKKAQENMKKSVSDRAMKVDDGEDDEMERVEQRGPQTARLERTVTIGDGDQSVDAQADDFINRFRKQLKLQRLDSLLRYKEMLQGK